VAVKGQELYVRAVTSCEQLWEHRISPGFRLRKSNAWILKYVFNVLNINNPYRNHNEWYICEIIRNNGDKVTICVQCQCTMPCGDRMRENVNNFLNIYFYIRLTGKEKQLQSRRSPCPIAYMWCRWKQIWHILLLLLLRLFRTKMQIQYKEK